MDAWRDERQYSQNAIIKAVQRYMYHEDRTKDLRFANVVAEDLARTNTAARQGHTLLCSQMRAWAQTHSIREGSSVTATALIIAGTTEDTASFLGRRIATW